MRRNLVRAGVGLGLAAFVVFTLGCMNLSFGGRTQVVPAPAPEHAVSIDGVQRGKAFASHAQEITVYYPVPYASPPNLEFEDDVSKRNVQIIEQKADCFRVKNLHAAGELAWKARGVLTATAKTPTTSGVVQTGTTSPSNP